MTILPHHTPSRGRLCCKICDVKIKGELLWPSHVAAKSHKEAIEKLKNAALVPKKISNQNKELNSELINSPINNFRMPSQVSDSPLPTQSLLVPKKSILKRKTDESCVLVKRIKEDESISTQPCLPQPESAKSDTETNNDNVIDIPLPPDFFDSKDNSAIDDNSDVSENITHLDLRIQPEEIVDEQPIQNTKQSPTVDAIIPKGFFDDPELDAKIRGVKMPQEVFEDEWRMFQRLVVQEESKLSEEMKEEEEDKTNIANEIEEIEDQIHKWNQIESLHIKKTTITIKNPTSAELGKRVSSSQERISSSEEEESDYEDISDMLENDSMWRNKKI
ncbi:unnamed protein product [Gordionus sp. m RMFG-2023]